MDYLSLYQIALNWNGFKTGVPITQDSLYQEAVAIWKSGLEAVDARKLVRELISVSGNELKVGELEFPIEQLDNIIVVGFGKASGAMAAGLEDAIDGPAGRRLSVKGLINVPNDKTVRTHRTEVRPCRPPGENLPTAEVVAATREIVNLVQSAQKNDLCICLVSGGGSALLELPAEPIDLDEFRTATSFLSRSGASIYELNAVRSAISQVKGGGLARQSRVPMVALILSDVIGDSLQVIASGATALDSQSNIMAIDVLEKYDPDHQSIPTSVWSVADSAAVQSDTDDRLDVHNFIVGNIDVAIRSAQEKAIALGYQVESAPPSGNEGDAGVVGRQIGKSISTFEHACDKFCLLTGGETTVNLGESPGQGGRNQQLVLSCIAELLNHDSNLENEYCLLSAGTDGEDGNVPVAGAIFTSNQLESLRKRNPKLASVANKSLERFDSHTFLSDHDMVLQVGPTNTNVCDLRVLLVRKKEKN